MFLEDCRRPSQRDPGLVGSRRITDPACVRGVTLLVLGLAGVLHRATT
ncbi:MAG: hypothetical protein SCH98_11065 [Deferrisomatales bacterium]|nr:hypothetical protein [Deferrisomatales bacterium]